MQDVGFSSANPCPNAEAPYLLIPQNDFDAFLWGQGIDRPFGNFASHWSAILLRFNPGITGVSPEFACVTSTVGLRRRQINELIDFRGLCRDVAACVGIDLRTLTPLI